MLHIRSVSRRSGGHSIGGTVRARAAEELRNRILTGGIAPGTRLDLDALTIEFGASRTPIPEALLQLSYEGLGGRGGGVVPPTFCDVFPARKHPPTADHDEFGPARPRRAGAAARAGGERHVTDAGGALARFLEGGPRRPPM